MKWYLAFSRWWDRHGGNASMSDWNIPAAEVYPRCPKIKD